MATSPNYPAAQTFPVPGRTVIARDLPSGPVEAASPEDANRALLPSEVSSAADSAQESSINLSKNIDYSEAQLTTLENTFLQQQKILDNLLQTKSSNPNYLNIDNLIATQYIAVNSTREEIINTKGLIDNYKSQLGFQDVAPAKIGPDSIQTTIVPTTGDPLGDVTNYGLGVEPPTPSRGIIYSQIPSTLQQTSANTEDTASTLGGGVYIGPTTNDEGNVTYNSAPPISVVTDTTASQAATETSSIAPPPVEQQAINPVNLVGYGKSVQPDDTQPDGGIGISDGIAGSIPGITASNNNAANPAITTSNVTDWRFRISLAQGALYLYNVSVSPTTDILFPLRATRGVIFPYTPKIDVTYSANYDATDITHTNYKFYNYKNSSVDTISISGDFTAQDTAEANYVLAVIHFFRSVTKMWYGNDTNPRAGTPPPLVYLSGHGSYAFNMHPVVITAFSLSYPTDVDYINAGILAGQGRQLPQYTRPIVGRPSVLDRLRNSKLDRNGYSARSANTVNNATQGSVDTSASTRIPTKLTINLTALPVITRNTISNKFSLQEYATGKLLRGNVEKGNGGGIW